MNNTNEPVDRRGGEVDELAALRNLRASAPPDFARRVMTALPDAPDRSWADLILRFWPEGGRWWLPALAGAAAALLAVVSIRLPVQRTEPERIAVHFELHAPAAQTVELLGDFTGWKSEAIRLTGPDASGHWTADVKLPAGRHEYIFLVDGRQWQTDPRADVRRADGFGRENAVVEL
jgi:hypothetical protein